VEVVLASTAEQSEILEFAQQLQAKAHRRMFAFRPDRTKIDEARSEIHIDREKAAEMGLKSPDGGQD